METTPNTPNPRPESKTYTLNVVFTVDERTDEQLYTERAISDEASSWLESLNATVHCARVTRAD